MALASAAEREQAAARRRTPLVEEALGQREAAVATRTASKARQALLAGSSRWHAGGALQS